MTLKAILCHSRPLVNLKGKWFVIRHFSFFVSPSPPDERLILCNKR